MKTVDQCVPGEHSRLMVVGAGTMGTQIALQAALHGVQVTLTDVSAEQLASAREHIDALLTSRVAKGRLTTETASASRACVSFVQGISDACAVRPDWVIEAVVEQLEVKRELFKSLIELLPPHVGLATNSSHIRADSIAGEAPWADRFLNMHFFHPVLVMDLVEVVGGPRTKPEYVDAAMSWATRMGRTAVRLDADVDGFLVNRILGEASREAFRLLTSEVAGFEAIDLAVTKGLRWPLGPFQLADLSGLDVLRDSRQRRYELHGDAADLATVQVLTALIESGRLGRKSGIGFYDYSSSPPTPVAVPMRTDRPTR